MRFSPHESRLTAPASTNRIVLGSQMWALPVASQSFVDPTGTNPNVVSVDAKGNFVAKEPVSTLSGTGKYGLAVFSASGAINAAREFMLELTLASSFKPMAGQKNNIRALTFSPSPGCRPRCAEMQGRSAVQMAGCSRHSSQAGASTSSVFTLPVRASPNGCR